MTRSDREIQVLLQPEHRLQTAGRLPLQVDIHPRRHIVRFDRKWKTNSYPPSDAGAESTDFGGNLDFWVHRETAIEFCSQLQALEHTRRGEAALESISPGELKLVINSVTSRGHMAVVGSIARQVYAGEESYSHRLDFGFGFDPSQFTVLMREKWVQDYLSSLNE
jgi:hypothetical protein